MPYSLVLVGSTNHTLTATNQLLNSPDFKVLFAITPEPKPQGKQKTLVQNPVQTWAEKQNIPTVLIKDKINDQEQAQVQRLIQNVGKPDYLLVVDFGYKIPNWLLGLANFHPINIHPSDLPRWRGSSPGQFVLLNGEKESAISIITMSSNFDQGEIVSKIPFSVGENWTQKEYYHQAFDLVAKELPEILIGLAENKITPRPQPTKSPTPTANRLTKEDSFRDWQLIMSALSGEDQKVVSQIEQATRAFQPWPILWTLVDTKHGQKRMKILETIISSGKLELIKVQIEGGQPAHWNQVKNQIEETN